MAQRQGGGCSSILWGFMIGAGLAAAAAWFAFDYNAGIALIAGSVGGALGATVSWVSLYGPHDEDEQDPYDMDNWDR